MTPLRLVFAFTALKLLAHLLTNHQYGYFRDELYYLACSEHLDWGYPDAAPLTAVYAWIGKNLLGGSLPAIRLLSALAGAAKVLLTGLFVIELGGRRFAVALACLSVIVAPIYLALDTLLSMNSFEPVFWMGVAYCALLAVRRGQPRWWLAAGVLVGLGLENKHSMAFFTIALFGALLLTPHRRALRERWFWYGAAAAVLLALPNLIWQWRHDWATWELLMNVRRTGKNVELGPLAFLGQQVFFLLPPTVLIWGAGLWRLLRAPAAGERFLGYAWIGIFLIMMLAKAKHYYLVPSYPMLFAAGGVFWEGALRGRGRAVLLPVIGLSGLVFAPIGLPTLPPEKLVAYMEILRIAPPKSEVAHAGPLPQHLGDMFGWPEMVERVARIYHALPPTERSRAAIYAGNYGEAGAIDFLGGRYGLPKSISGHQAYWFWGPRDFDGSTMIVLQWSRATAERLCTSVENAGPTGHPWGMAEENYDILICRGLKEPVAQLWPRAKHWN
jgi:hypothetical protein